MTVLYQSTRDKENVVTASQAILQGLAVDGGLYVPTQLPAFQLDFQQLANQSYQEIAEKILQGFLADFTPAEIKACVKAAYDEKFSTPTIAPVVKKGNDYYLELFHGPTFAFKDLALSILPYLLTTSAKKNQSDKEIVILTATSGDTGKAAMAGFMDVPHTKIIVFYPENGVSKIQEKQMVTQKGENTFVVAVKGNFDDAQTAVKAMFNNEELKARLAQNKMQFSSANSMNIGRLVPQIVYYVYTYAQLVKQGEIQIGEKINVSVPTGNFGNILAAYYAKKIGVPINRLICASNDNKVLTDFFATGEYNKNRPFYLTTSPSMDIVVSSNLERLIYHLTGNDPQQTKDFMLSLTTQGNYQISPAMMAELAEFYSDFATEAEVEQGILATFTNEEYVIDPHTAVAERVLRKYQKETKDDTKSVIISTASPYKFPRTVVDALTKEPQSSDDFALVQEIATKSGIPVPQGVLELPNLPVRHHQVVSVAGMQAEVERILVIN